MKKDILAVDSDDLIRNMLVRMFKREFDVTPSPGGDDALYVVRNKRCDLIIMNSWPDMDPHRFIRLAREAKPRVPILLFTGGTSLKLDVNATYVKCDPTDGLRRMVAHLTG